MSRRSVYHPGQIDLFPPTSNWTPPQSLPFIPSGTTVAVDTETRDRGLESGMGPGWVHSEGHLCGVSWAWRTAPGEISAGYAPIRHPDTRCFAEEDVIRWLVDLEQRCELVFQNAGYDLGWTGLRPTRLIHDTHSQAVLLDENQREYNLDAIARRLGIPGKDESLLKEAVLTHGGDPKRIKAHIWRLPGRYVGPYAEQDAVATLMAHERQISQIGACGLTEAYDLERELSPVTIEMRRRGIPIDLDRAEENRAWFLAQRDRILGELRSHMPATYRRDITITDVRSPRWLELAFADLSVPFPRTKTGQGSFEKEWLERLTHPAGRAIAQARALHDAAEKFIGTYIMEYVHRGRLHAEIHQLRDDDGGTRSYRFSYSNPPLQQMNRAEPDKENPDHKDFTPGFIDIGTRIRECFKPERDCVWGAPDYSQQEYRLIVHYAARMKLPRAEEAVRYYRENEKADYHNLVVELTGLIRKKAKDANFAKAFGAGIPKFALMTGMSLEEATEVMRTYDNQLPFVKMFADKCSESAQRRGYVRLMDGRRSRFDEWEAAWVPPDEWNEGRREGHVMTPCSMEEAARRQAIPGHPWKGKRLKRAGTHKAGNRVIQGSAAVQTKRAMRACAREGHIPMLQMHDELCFSFSDKRDSDRVAQIMETDVELLVPVRVDNELGPDWGRAKYSFEKAMQMVRGGR